VPEPAIPQERTLGLLSTTAIGVGAIVGGGILALSGVAFQVSGPSAILALGLNGLIALLTALSFAELAAAFPYSGGIYTFAKRVLSVRAAFVLGWIFWFASILAGVLYALGFAFYVQIVLERLWIGLGGTPPTWLSSQAFILILAVLITSFQVYSLATTQRGDRDWVTFGKVLVFGALIAGGLGVLGAQQPAQTWQHLTPFFAGSAFGLFQAMGLTFILVQGFWVVAGVAGRVKEPARTLPRAMVLALGIALAIYLPLLFIVATVGVPPGTSIVALSEAYPVTLIAVAARTFLGPIGFWLVVVAALLAMFSALRGNLLAASWVAFTMARDRTLPREFSRLDKTYGTPSRALLASGSMLVLLLFIISDVAAAGAAAGLIFLLSFAIANGVSILVRRRGQPGSLPFRTPYFPLVPVLGGTACLALAVFLAVVVPTAGIITGIWLALGVGVYLTVFSRRARMVDASAEARDPNLVQFRGRSPLVLVPIANPAHAAVMVEVANALAPPAAGRVLLLSVVTHGQDGTADHVQEAILNTQTVLRESLTASFSSGLYPEALTTVAPEPWGEIARVTRTYACESLLLGLSSVDAQATQNDIDQLLSSVDSDVVILRPKPGWTLSGTRRILVPIGGGRGYQDILRARLLGSLSRTHTPEVNFLRVMPEGEPPERYERALHKLRRLAEDESPVPAQVDIARSNDPLCEIARRTNDTDLVILGLRRVDRRNKMLGTFALELARNTTCTIIMISRRG
jgi:APA family basic amino acid/polyamine antiporter